MNGYLSFVLHAHLPYVRHPEYEEFLEEDWLYEAITETYIPFLEMFDSLTKDNIPWNLTMTMSGTLVNMLNDELLRNRYVNHLNKLINLCELEVKRLQNFTDMLRVAEHNLWFHKRALDLYLHKYNKDLVGEFRKYQNQGNLEIIPVTATHGFLPLMKDYPEAVNAQIVMAKKDYEKNFGQSPKGIWLAECAYYPDQDRYLAKNGIRYFLVDSHGIQNSDPKPVYDIYAPVYTNHGVAAFARDLESSEQVWSSEVGYPGDGIYREFHKDAGYELDYDYIKPFLHSDGVRRNIGIKYHAITDKKGSYKEVYNPFAAYDKAKEHAYNFVFNRSKQLEYLASKMPHRKPIVVSPYDMELYGHWWYEGPIFLEWVFRAINESNFETITPYKYLEKYPTNQIVNLSMSSWGANGYYDVWIDGSNDYSYRHLHKGIERMIEVANGRKPKNEIEVRLLNQMARELMLAQTSCWEFIMFTGTMVGYAHKKISDHINTLFKLYEEYKSENIDVEWLEEIERRNNIFPNMDYTIYSRQL